MRISRLVCAAALALAAGCSSKNTTTAPKIHTVNTYAPNANARILSQATFGSSTGHSSVWELVPDGSNGLYFYGGLENLYVVGQLGASGGLVRFSNTGGPEPRGIVSLSATAAEPNGFIAAAAHDTDNDGSSEVGHVYLYTSAGDRSSHVVLASDSSDVWLSCIAAVSDSLYVVAGGERTPHRLNPYIATVALTPAGQLEVRQSAVVTQLAGEIRDVVVNPAEPVGPTLGIYVSTMRVDQGGTWVPTVHRITLGFPSLTPCTVDWSQPISPTGAHSGCVQDLCLYADRLYLAGYADDPAAKPASESGAQWHSGIAASLTLSGNVEWSEALRLTSGAEELYQVVPAPGALYMVGMCAAYQMTSTKELYGYGWITSLDPSTGTPLRNLTLGGDTYQSGINSATAVGGKLRCGGWTRCAIAYGPSLGWVCDVDVSSLVPDSPGAAPLHAADGRREPPAPNSRVSAGR